MTDTLAQALSRHVAMRRFEDLPPDAIQATRLLLRDTLAVGWAGSAFAGLEAMRGGTLGGAALGPCDVWGTGGRARALDAIFLNGVAAAALEFDSLHDAGLVHADLVCVPAVFAFAQERHASGRELIAAVALACDVTCRLALGAAEHTGWWHSSIYGVFGAAAGCARLLGLDEHGIAQSLGIALGHTGGTQQAIVEQTGLKRVQSAIAARGGAHSALLAAWGVSAPTEPFAGRHGLYARFERGGDEKIVLDGLGRRFEGMLSSYKKFPTCGCGHAATEAALQLAVEHALDESMIESAVIRISPYMNGIVGAPYSPADNPTVAAQFSVRYCVASAVARKRVGLQEIEPASALDPRLLAFANRIAIEVDETNSGKLAPAEVRLTLRDGRVLARRVEEVPGTRANPMTESDLRAKARDCLVRGTRPLDAAQCDEWLRRLDALEICADAADLFAPFHSAEPGGIRQE
ncbi:MmgE/PrpD family protein (plasmid) [Variovorax sp. SRS16]|uniref:MmgE/PrpD family protein n=1 Tax=Variovorax sp. SRS16 TaxID=282217 RepID=UPI001317DB76|nr:MmgE/PrpD family protein [Variovorax sp. SRS16]VTU46313.1 MmgE/PrpD family protein [Variovorax sp. SRS16]